MPGKVGAVPDRANATMMVGNPVDLRAHLRGCQKGVTTSVHRGAAGMRGLTPKSDRVPLDAKGPKHGSERQIQIEQYRSLFDVQLDIGAAFCSSLPTILQTFKIDSVLGEDIDQGNRVLVVQSAGLLEIDVTSSKLKIRKGSCRTGRPPHQPSRPDGPNRRLAAIVTVDPAQDSSPASRFKDPSSQPPFGNRIDVPTNDECLLGSSRQRGPDVPRLVAMDLHREFFELISKPVSRFGPGRCKGDPLGSILIRRKRPEFLKFAKRPLRIESAFTPWLSLVQRA